MSKIKSTRAYELISYGALSQEYVRTKCGYSLITTVSAREAVIIAETELTEKYEQQLQAVHNMYKEMFIEHERDVNFNIHHSENNHAIELQELRDGAVDYICLKHCGCKFKSSTEIIPKCNSCEIMTEFTAILKN